MGGDVAFDKQYPQFFRDNRHAEQGTALRGVVHLVFAGTGPAGRDIFDQKGVFERRTGAFHFRRRPGEQANAAAIGKARSPVV